MKKIFSPIGLGEKSKHLVNCPELKSDSLQKVQDIPPRSDKDASSWN
jgi:hypothetical protein